MFTNHRIATLAATAVVTTGLGLVSFLSAAAAAATTVDDYFLSVISDADIAYESPTAAISNAHGVCDALGDGQSATSLGRQILTNSDLNPNQAAVFVVASVNAYCPAYSDQLNA